MFKSIVIALSLIICRCLPSFALFDAQIDTWYSEADGSFAEISGRAADLRGDLGLTEATEAVGASLAFGLHHQVYLDSISFSLDGAGTNRDQFHLNDLSIASGSSLRSELDISSVTAAYRFEVGSDLLRLGFMAGIQKSEFDLAVKPDAGARASSESEAVIPIVGLFASGHPLPFANFKASTSLGKYDFGSDESSSLKLELQVLMEIPPGFYLGFGYRRLELMHESADFDIDTTLQGPMAFLGFRL